MYAVVFLPAAQAEAIETTLFFRIVDNVVFVIACFHSSRDPRIWQDRIA